MTLSLGARLGPYEVVATLGAGGMGEVYRARDTQLKRDVALKVLPAAVAADPERLARFQREAELLAALSHPHIAQIHGLAEADGGRALVMELVEGPTLAERIARDPVSLDEALPLATQIAEALEYAHESGVVHRDLKPANIMIAADGAVKVLDFGLAKALEPAAGGADAAALTNSPTITSPAALTRAGVILGTAGYMSPEQARGVAVDKRSDIWAFGAVLFEMLTGQPCFAGDTVTDVLAAVVKSEPDWTRLPTGTPARVRELLHRCLAKDRKQRLRDIGDARLDIAAAVSHPQPPEPHTARPVSWGWLLSVGGILVLLASAGASLVTWHAKPAPHNPRVRSTIEMPRGVQLTIGVRGPAYAELALSPDGEALVFSAGASGTIDNARLYRRPLDRFEASPIPGTEGGRAPFFSPDGRWLAFWAGGKLKKCPVDGGIPAVICECPQTPMGASWGPGGAIVIGTNADGLWLVDAQGGVLRRLTTPRQSTEASHVLPWFLPDGRTLLFTVKPHIWGVRSHIEVLTLGAVQRKIVVESGADARFLPTGHIVYMAEGTLMAAPYDAVRAEVRGPSVPVVEKTMQALNALRSLENSGAGQFTVSPSGTLAYVSGGIVPDLAAGLEWVDRAGTVSPLAELEGRPIASVKLSPDNRSLAYRTVGQKGEVWAYDLASGTSRRITREGRAMHLCWTSDGARLTFAYSRAGQPGIFWVAADGSAGEPEPLITGEFTLQPSEWSHDGRLLLYVEDHPKTGFNIWVYRRENGEKAPLFAEDYNEEYPTVSRDGRWLAYCSEETGRFEVYITAMAHPGKGAPVTSDGGIAPAWSSDGRTLYYWNVDRTRMMAVDLAADSGVRVGKARTLFALRMNNIDYVRPYDITRDGQRFIIPTWRAAPPIEVTEFNVVQNWFEELKAKVPTGR